ncbi:MAG: hypothetical protein DRR08_33130 [Candidatus Parabeggiatoa sp. nov. 2]|jgi:drug/metabolite transporter (DMT)-like permease|nr:MAG: hypothetical protein B6247_17930 [Beggiatoa sp. 4572_84]RKZ46668.1 MAG: hypothetical protein DRR08_33130 [Gammaproteobacteria bacterium]
MKWTKILGFALLNAILGVILFFSFAWLLSKYTGHFSSLVTYGVPVATVIGACIIESRKARLPFWGILIATVVLPMLVALMLMFMLMPTSLK